MLAVHCLRATPLQCECQLTGTQLSQPWKLGLERCFWLSSETGLHRLQFVGQTLSLVYNRWPSVFVYKVLLECHFLHVLKYSVWLLSRNNSRAEWLWQKPYHLQWPENICSLASYRKSMVTPIQGRSVTEEIKHFPNPALVYLHMRLLRCHAVQIQDEPSPETWSVPSQSQLFPLKVNVLVTREISLEIYSGAFFSFVFSPSFPSIQPNVSM